MMLVLYLHKHKQEDKSRNARTACCSRTLVCSELVPREKILEGSVTTICCAHGDTLLYPLAEVEVQVADKLPMSVLLSTDVPFLGKLLHIDDACAVLT